MDSLINHILGASSTRAMPHVGMGATMLFASDRVACTVVHVSCNGKRVQVQRDHAHRADSNGMSECQTWDHDRNPEGAIYVFSLRSNARWVQVGSCKSSGNDLLLGHRETYHDFSF